LLGQRLPLLRPAPVVALTATATPIVQRDIVAQLGLSGSARLFIHGFRRENLALETLEVAAKERPARALSWLSGPGRLPAIVYASRRKATEAAAELLATRHRAAAYHAGLSGALRESVQNDFLAGRLDVVVATVAFGMGVDKADIRTVLHLGLPKRQGRGVFLEWQTALGSGQPPASGALEGMLVFASGALFLLPGVLTDVLAVLLLLSPVRKRVAQYLRALLGFDSRQAEFSIPVRRAAPGPGRRRAVLDTEGEAVPDADEEPTGPHQLH
jgi:UPF0716 family protein affecting phage T7 exclusion